MQNPNFSTVLYQPKKQQVFKPKLPRNHKRPQVANKGIPSKKTKPYDAEVAFTPPFKLINPFKDQRPCQKAKKSSAKAEGKVNQSLLDGLTKFHNKKKEVVINGKRLCIQVAQRSDHTATIKVYKFQK